jgi:2-polyprenyl-3-methyl-5-hydroxy-6-metoxy-1,4-benzoquinol methylase
VSHFDAHAATWDDDPAKVRRAHEVADAIRAAVPVTPGMGVLEYGCGTGLLGLALAPHVARLTLADASEGMLEVLRRKLAAGAAPHATALRLDLEKDPLPADRYHLVCSLQTLHHVHDLDRVLGQLRAALLRGGTLCVADLDAEDGSFHGHGADVHHGFDRAALAARLRAAGFSEPAFTTVFEIDRIIGGASKRFGVFLAVARAA